VFVTLNEVKGAMQGYGPFAALSVTGFGRTSDRDGLRKDVWSGRASEGRLVGTGFGRTSGRDGLRKDAR